MHRSEPLLKMSLWMLLFLGLAEACIPREVATEEKINLLKGIVGLMSRLSPDGLRHNIISSKTPPWCPHNIEHKKKCYCHYCNPELDI
ncbi:epididymal protein 13 precursor, partial [Daubentonia madagascariensis]